MKKIIGNKDLKFNIFFNDSGDDFEKLVIQALDNFLNQKTEMIK